MHLYSVYYVRYNYLFAKLAIIIRVVLLFSIEEYVEGDAPQWCLTREASGFRGRCGRHVQTSHRDTVMVDGRGDKTIGVAFDCAHRTDHRLYSSPGPHHRVFHFLLIHVFKVFDTSFNILAMTY